MTFPAALVVNGTAFALTAEVVPIWNEPTAAPELLWNENARPFMRFTARTHDSAPGAPGDLGAGDVAGQADVALTVP